MKTVPRNAGDIFFGEWSMVNSQSKSFHIHHSPLTIHFLSLSPPEYFSMTISYKWLNDYLPVVLEPEKLSRILTSVGLEVEDLHKYEEVKGGLQGLVIGEVLNVEKHPNADKLTVTKVNVGDEELQIVCGAPNVAAGQKVIVAKPG